jgi:hypothetical protein
VALTFRHVYLSGNLTRYFATDDGHGHEIAYIPLTMINANVGFQGWWLRLNFGINYRGNFTQEPTDSRLPLKEYVLFNPTVVFSPAGFPLQLRLGGRNLLNYDVRYPSSSLDYPGNFPGRRAEVWADISYSLRF